MSVLDKFLDAIRLNDDYEDEDEFFDDDDMEEIDEDFISFFISIIRRLEIDAEYISLVLSRILCPSSKRKIYFSLTSSKNLLR